MSMVILGLGQTSLSLIRHFSGHAIVVYDTREDPPLRGALDAYPQVTFCSGEDWPIDAIAAAEAIYLTPGKPWQKDSRLSDHQQCCRTDIDVFMKKVEVPVLAVTGTNGKSTVASWTSQLLAHAGVQVALGGNIGTPVLNLSLKGVDVVVLELSSAQLLQSQLHAFHGAWITNVSPDHLDWHDTLEEYYGAKSRIYEKALHIAALPDHCPACVQHLPVYQQLNYRAALGLSRVFDSRVEAHWPLEMLPHRGERLLDSGGVTWVNNSKATNVGAALAVLPSSMSKVIWLIGGDPKGVSLSAFESSMSQAKAVIAYGLASEIPWVRERTQVCPDFFEALEWARSLAIAGDEILLAPGCSSLDQFSSYAKRGEAFMAMAQL